MVLWVITHSKGCPSNSNFIYFLRLSKVCPRMLLSGIPEFFTPRSEAPASERFFYTRDFATVDVAFPPSTQMRWTSFHSLTTAILKTLDPNKSAAADREKRAGRCIRVECTTIKSRHDVKAKTVRRIRIECLYP